MGRALVPDHRRSQAGVTADLCKLLDNQILPTFERATLGAIDTLVVREWIAGLVEQGLSPSRVRNAHQVLS